MDINKLEKEFKDGWTEIYKPLNEKRDKARENISLRKKINHKIGREFKKYFENFINNKLLRKNYSILETKNLPKIVKYDLKNKFDFVIISNNNSNNISALIKIRSHGIFWPSSFTQKVLQKHKEYVDGRTKLAKKFNAKLFLISFKDRKTYYIKMIPEFKKHNINLSDYYNFILYPSTKDESNYDSYESNINESAKNSEFEKFLTNFEKLFN